MRSRYAAGPIQAAGRRTTSTSRNPVQARIGKHDETNPRRWLGSWHNQILYLTAGINQRWGDLAVGGFWALGPGLSCAISPWPRVAVPGLGSSLPKGLG